MSSSAEPYLVSTTNENSYGAINTSQIEENQPVAENPIKVLIREIRSGKQRLAPVLVYSLIAVVGASLNGFMLGFTSVLVINMSKHAYYVEEGQNMQFIGSISTVGALIAGLITGVVSDKIGRKTTFLLACIPYSFGFLLLAYSFPFMIDGDKGPEPTQPSVLYLVFLLAGRALSGFGAGAMSLVVPVYVVEIAPSSLKGLFGALNQLSVTVGILVIYILNTFVAYYITSLIVMAIVLVFAMCVLFIPESPRWLVANRHELEANNVLYKIRGPRADVAREMRQLKKVVESQSEISFWDKLAMFRRASVLVPMILSIALMFFQQFCGINIVIFYAGSVLKSADVSKPDLAADFGVGIIQVLATFVGVLLVDILGRKILLITGGVLLTVSTGVLGVYFFLHDNICHGKISNAHPFCDSHFGYLAVGCLAIFIIGFSIGWGPIPWLMMTELAPMQVRGIMSGVATAINWTFAAIITLSFEYYVKGVHTYGAWWTFCGISFLSILFTIFLLPETKGKELEDIEEYFNQRYSVKKKTIDNE